MRIHIVVPANQYSHSFTARRCMYRIDWLKNQFSM